MATTVGIIGLGQVGASLGLALRQRGGVDRVLGHTRSAATARAARDLGAVDDTTGPKDVVRGSDIIFMCLPLAEMRSMLECLSSWVRPRTFLLDTAPIRADLNRWVEELLPAEAQHVGLVPAPNPAMLGPGERGINAAHAELFRRSTIMLVPSPRTTGAATELALNVVRLLGAAPLLVDAAEGDGIMTTAHLLPQLAASALIEASTGTAGWLEARKLAGKPFATVTGGMAYFDDPVSVESATLANSARVVHGLDVLIATLKGMRDDIDKQDREQVAARLSHSHKAREGWLDERNGAAWLSQDDQSPEMPGLGEHMTQLLFGGRIVEATRGSAEKRPTRR